MFPHIHIYLFPLLGFLFCSPGSLLIAQGCEIGEVEIKIVVVADDYPQEISWDLRDENGNPLATGTEGEYRVCTLPGSCLTWSIFDLANDGICCTNGLGFYQLFIDEVQVATGGDYNSGASHNLNCPVGTDCESPLPLQVGTHATAGVDNWYRFQPSELGLYKINTCNAQACATSVFVYEDCTEYDLGPIGALAYNTGGCENGNGLTTVGLSNDETYLIRVYNASCAENINWDLTFEGAVIGCTDGTACNFDPFATVAQNETCLYFPDQNCPGGLPDLKIDQDVLLSSFHLDSEEISDQCLVNEGCASGYGQRDIVRFSTRIHNIGDADFVIGSPADDDISHQFEWDQCHQHWHYEGYAAYQLFDALNNPLPTGFKNGFCVLDLVCPSSDMFRYTCGTMGISSGCYDEYASALPCQWLDITDVPDGFYTLVVKVNWDESTDRIGRAESDYENNYGKVCFNLSRTNGLASIDMIDSSCSPPLDCMNIPYGLSVSDCNGECNGTKLSGDVNNDGVQNFEDVAAMIQKVFVQTNETPSACDDLNGDGKLNVVDAYYLYGCFKQNFLGQVEDPNNDLCNFPFGNSNLQQTTELSLLAVNLLDSYVDVGIKNPLNEVAAFEFDLEGLKIDFVVSLIEQDDLTLSIDRNSEMGKVTGYIISQDPIFKNVETTPFLRIYFDDISDSEVCLSAVQAVVNELFEEVNFEIAQACLEVEALPSGLGDGLEVNEGKQDDISVYPNPCSGKEYVTVTFSNPNFENFTLIVYDLNGASVFVRQGITEEQTIIKGLEPGEMYTYTLYSKTLVYSGKLVCI